MTMTAPNTPVSAPRMPRVALALSLAGVLPFAAALAMLWFGPARFHTATLAAMATWSAVVLSFLGGIQWGTGLAVQEAAPQSAQSLFLLSVVPVLLGWAMLFIESPGARLLIAVFLFAFVWLIDALLRLQKLLPPWFFRLRSIVTPIVIACLLAALLTL